MNDDAPDSDAIRSAAADAGITDHICPWQSCYRSTRLLAGHNRFILSTSGHVAAMVNPPGNDKARYQVANVHDH